jgi:hypothetical protein
VQTKLKIAKPNHWHGKQPKRLMSHCGWKDSVCFESGARVGSFAAVLKMLSRSNMYKLPVVNQEK